MLSGGLTGLAVRTRPRRSRIGFKRRLGSGVLACAVAAGLASEVRAQDTTLADLVAGDVLISLSGDLLFSDFEATMPPSGDVAPNLENYEVQALEDGFRVIPAPDGLSIATGQGWALAIDYRVTGEAGIQIEETLLSFDGAATGTGALALTSQDYFGDASEPQPLGEAVVHVTGAGGSITSASFMLPEAVDSIYVLAGLQVAVPEEASAASISWVDQEFVTVPEPGSALLALTALLSLGALKRIRPS